jgi:hypothetical protein
MKKGIEWFSILTEKQQSKFRANTEKSFHNLVDMEFTSFFSFMTRCFPWESSKEGHDYWYKIACQIPSSEIVHTHFHIVYLTGENKCTGVNIQAVDMIDALKQFESKNNGVKPIYCYAK